MKYIFIVISMIISIPEYSIAQKETENCLDKFLKKYGKDFIKNTNYSELSQISNLSYSKYSDNESFWSNKVYHGDLKNYGITKKISNNNVVLEITGNLKEFEKWASTGYDFKKENWLILTYNRKKQLKEILIGTWYANRDTSYYKSKKIYNRNIFSVDILKKLTRMQAIYLKYRIIGVLKNIVSCTFLFDGRFNIEYYSEDISICQRKYPEEKVTIRELLDKGKQVNSHSILTCD